MEGRPIADRLFQIRPARADQEEADIGMHGRIG
ncbi:hypothetical protein X770_25470 [Mesorhizobium sp. LSJC269B00]|nr:hypothetical protein X770_25470 [Mesorhizobium sp. LSJC269B00]ESX47924.1 hypothetical protein X761_28875 [Mesorhizobium sp. LSHC424B00]